MIRIPFLSTEKLQIPPGMTSRRPDRVQFPGNTKKPVTNDDGDIPPVEKKARLSPTFRPADEIKIEYFEN